MPIHDYSCECGNRFEALGPSFASPAVRNWHDHLTRRGKLEQKYPELGGDRRPVLAHEGRFDAAPLRAGDPVPGGSVS